MCHCSFMISSAAVAVAYSLIDRPYMCTHDDDVSTAAGAVHHSSVVGVHVRRQTDRQWLCIRNKQHLSQNRSYVYVRHPMYVIRQIVVRY